MGDELAQLIELAESALRIEDGAVDAFIDHVDGYIAILEGWSSAALEQQLPPELKPQVERLNGLHEQVIERASRLSKDLGAQLGTANKKGRVLRAYVDRLPARITITGRRKG